MFLPCQLLLPELLLLPCLLLLLLLLPCLLLLLLPELLLRQPVQRSGRDGPEPGHLGGVPHVARPQAQAHVVVLGLSIAHGRGEHSTRAGQCGVVVCEGCGVVVL